MKKLPSVTVGDQDLTPLQVHVLYDMLAEADLDNEVVRDVVDVFMAKCERVSRLPNQKQAE